MLHTDPKWYVESETQMKKQCGMDGEEKGQIPKQFA